MGMGTVELEFTPPAGRTQLLAFIYYFTVRAQAQDLQGILRLATPPPRWRRLAADDITVKA
jgi:hypothetical protein